MVSFMTYDNSYLEYLFILFMAQVLPWESLPILRKHEVYRMPSVSSILAVMAHRSNAASVDGFGKREKSLLKGRKNTKQERSSRKTIKSSVLEQPARLPTVDPYNTFYLLNPSGDLGSTQAAFEDWFKNQKGWEVRSAREPVLLQFLFFIREILILK